MERGSCHLGVPRVEEFHTKPQGVPHDQPQPVTLTESDHRVLSTARLPRNCEAGTSLSSGKSQRGRQGGSRDLNEVHSELGEEGHLGSGHCALDRTSISKTREEGGRWAEGGAEGSLRTGSVLTH